MTESRCYTLLASPFLQARQLRQFIDAVQTLPGVEEAELVGFRRAVFEMKVRYQDHVPFEDRLAAMSKLVTLVMPLSRGVLRIQVSEPEWE